MFLNRSPSLLSLFSLMMVQQIKHARVFFQRVKSAHGFAFCAGTSVQVRAPPSSPASEEPEAIWSACLMRISKMIPPTYPV